MTRRLVDCGFIVGILELSDDSKPMLTLVQPETDDAEAKSLVIWEQDVEGLHNLRDALSEYLDAYDERAEQPSGGPAAFEAAD